MMPVEPSWLLAALGMVDIDPASVFDGRCRAAMERLSFALGCLRHLERCNGSS